MFCPIRAKEGLAEKDRLLQGFWKVSFHAAPIILVPTNTKPVTYVLIVRIAVPDFHSP